MNGLTTLKTLTALGPAAVARVSLYRLGLRLGRHPVQRIAAVAPQGPFFAAPSRRRDLPPPNDRWTDRLWWFDWFTLDRGDGPPDWHVNPFGGGRGDQKSRWWDVPDFAAGDIKGVWELSRLGWLTAFATQTSHGDMIALGTMNAWLESWLRENPPYRGVNWKCGQEASIRVIHLLAAALILDQDRSPQPALLEMVALHLKRIAPTMSYAIGQNNNHGTSEAAAMFVGGSFLAALGRHEGAGWAETGRRWLENRARHLIERDGSFSQYSVVYHRLMLDTYVFVESWRRRYGLAPFSQAMADRLAAATRWLDAMVDRRTGDAPNLGANDGARILPLTTADFRDFRPSLQSASALFRERRALESVGPWDDQLRWLGIASPETSNPSLESETFDDGGFHVLRSGAAVAYMRYPRFRFRPSQADLLHLDLWIDGENWLRDGGSFSYNNSPEDTAYFNGAVAHNTVQFDERDQMPRLGRFLYGAWPKARHVVPVHENDDGIRAAAAYRDAWGAEHRREIVMGSNLLRCIDQLSGTAERAVLRWRLKPGDWRLSGDSISNDRVKMTIESDDPQMTLTLSEGWESCYYLRKTPLPVLEIAVRVPATIRTRIDF